MTAVTTPAATLFALHRRSVRVGRAEVLEGAHAGDWIKRLREPGYAAVMERA